MLSARAAPFRQLSRSGDEAVAAGDIEKRLQRRIRAARPAGRAGRRRRTKTAAEDVPLWQEPQASPEAALLRQQDSATIRRLVAALPQPFREAIVLREINDLSYQEIAEVAGVPVGTVMSRLARARSMLRAAWNVAEGAAS